MPRSVEKHNSFKRFWPLGWSAFGGPTAHLAVFDSLFITRLRWISANHFTEMIAVAQSLPGPSSTQVSFAIGLVYGRSIVCGVVSGILFQYPGNEKKKQKQLYRQEHHYHYHYHYNCP